MNVLEHVVFKNEFSYMRAIRRLIRPAMFSPGETPDYELRIAFTLWRMWNSEFELFMYQD